MAVVLPCGEGSAEVVEELFEVFLLVHQAERVVRSLVDQVRRRGEPAAVDDDVGAGDVCTTPARIGSRPLTSSSSRETRTRPAGPTTRPASTPSAPRACSASGHRRGCRPRPAIRAVAVRALGDLIALHDALPGCDPAHPTGPALNGISGQSSGEPPSSHVSGGERAGVGQPSRVPVEACCAAASCPLRRCGR